MPPSHDTTKRLIQAALKLFASRGYHNTSIADILRESGCTRGVLYYHFSSKEELGYAAIDEAVQLLVQGGAASHLRSDEHPIDRLLKALGDLPSGLTLEGTGDLGVGIGARMACVHEGFRKRLIARLAPLVEAVEQMLRKGVADGHIVNTVDPRELAHVAILVAHGIQMASLLGQGEVMSEHARRWITRYLNSLRA